MRPALRAERRGQATAVRDPAGGDHRCRRNRIDDGRQREGPEGAGVSARFTTLGDDDVGPGRAAVMACVSVCTWTKTLTPRRVGRGNEGRRVGERVR